jgi:hypothetical protein
LPEGSPSRIGEDAFAVTDMIVLVDIVPLTAIFDRRSPTGIRAPVRPHLPAADEQTTASAIRDDLSTRWKGDCPTVFADHPGRPSHDSPMLAHPSLAERFLAIVGSPELIWQAISPTTNRTLLADLRREQRHYPVDHPWMDQLLLEVPSCQTARRTKPCLWEHKRECRLGGTAVEKCSL